MRFSVCWARAASLSVEQRPHAIELVQDFLEPQLVDLVDDDEQQLVVLGAVGARLLQASSSSTCR